MYGMTNSGKLFSDELTNWLIYVAGFKKSKCQNFKYYKYSPDGPNMVVLSCVYDCVFLVHI